MISRSSKGELQFFRCLVEELSYKPLWLNFDSLVERSGAKYYEVDSDNFDLAMRLAGCKYEFRLSDKRVKILEILSNK